MPFINRIPVSTIISKKLYIIISNNHIHNENYNNQIVQSLFLQRVYKPHKCSLSLFRPLIYARTFKYLYEYLADLVVQDLCDILRGNIIIANP